MKTVIKAVTIIGQPAVKRYEVGREYNQLKLATIEDFSQEFPDGWSNLVIGKTEDAEIVFEIVNAPYVLEYQAEDLKL